jgi:Golgi apparatus protein 1
MGGRVIECLRTKYANTAAELRPQCTTELIDVIQASKLDIQLDVKLYQKCKNVLGEKCPGTDKEDCLKLLYQKKKLTDKDCTEEVIRIIKEGRADIHVDPGLFMACQADILKYCNDIPIGNKILLNKFFCSIFVYLGSGKQLQCLLKISKSMTKSCKDALSKRQELWSGVS